MQSHWTRGDHVIVRDPLETRSTRTYTAITGDTTPNLPGWPYIVIQDSAEIVALYLPEATRLWRWNIIEQTFLEPGPTQGQLPHIAVSGKAVSR